MNLIGHAGRLADTLRSELDTTRPVKLLFHGDPGVGKTKLAEHIAEANKWDIETENGRNVTIDLVREWQHSLHCTSMFGDWKVKIINEADLMTAPAQDLMTNRACRSASPTVRRDGLLPRPLDPPHQPMKTLPIGYRLSIQ